MQELATAGERFALKRKVCYRFFKRERTHAGSIDPGARDPRTRGAGRAVRIITSIPSPDNGRVRSDGSFEVQGFPSDTVLSIGPLPGDWTLKAIEVEGRDFADCPLPVEHGATLSGVRIVLTSRPTTLRGVLRDEKQKPAEETLSGVRVVLTNRPTHVRGGLLDEKQQPADGTVVIFPEDTPRW